MNVLNDHHPLANMVLGHLLTCPGLTFLEVSLMVCPGLNDT
jgi:hypothetical protein